MSENDGFKRNERVVHPVKGAGTIYQDQNGFVNAMVEFDDHRNVVIGVLAGELKRSGFERGERVMHSVKGAGTIYQNQNGFVNAMVEFDDHRNVVIGVPADELKRSQTA